MIDLEQVDFAKGGGLVTVVCQDHLSGAVLMVAHANRESLELSVATGEMHYWSRSRGLWRKGSTSGNVQEIVNLRLDCDADAILARVRARGPACHTGSVSCFGSLAEAGGILERLDGVILERALSVGSDRGIAADSESLRDRAPTLGDNVGAGEGSHQFDEAASEKFPERTPGGGNNPIQPSNPQQNIPATPSYTQGLLLDRNLRLKKLGEEAAELVTACADGDRERACQEAADLLYHALVALRAVGGSLRDVERVLADRHERAVRSQ